MEEQQVADAIRQLEEAGMYPSLSAILKQIGHGSMRDVTRHRKALRPALADEETPLPSLPPEDVPSAPPPGVPPPVSAVSAPTELAHFRVRYRAATEAAHGSGDPYGPARQALAAVEFDFHQRRQTALRCLTRARQLGPLVAQEVAQHGSVATGSANAVAYAATLQQGGSPRAALLRWDMDVLRRWVGEREATRLVGCGEQPRWALTG
jgi:hypothetical protein